MFKNLDSRVRFCFEKILKLLIYHWIPLSKTLHVIQLVDPPIVYYQISNIFCL